MQWNHNGITMESQWNQDITSFVEVHEPSTDDKIISQFNKLKEMYKDTYLR